MTATFGCIVLTMGQRPDDVRRGVESLLAQRDVVVDVVVVGNGSEPAGAPGGVRTVALPENIGATAGRNAGVPHVVGELLLFLDDDARLPSADALASIARVFTDPSVAVVQPRVVDPHGRPRARRHLPRVGAGDAQQSSDVTSFWEGAVAVRREVFEAVRGFAEQLWYGHEGIDFAWRVMDAGYRVRYAGDIVANHPAPPVPTHGQYHYFTSRNRVWIARLHLPWLIAVPHIGIWLFASLIRCRSASALSQILRGYRDGLRDNPGPRRPIRWRTVWRMTRAGRPPII